MSTLVTFLHVVVCLVLVGTVLLQQGKGGGMGGAFGGANTATVFGSGGASNFLRRLTAIAATVFMLTSMVLAYIASNDAGDALKSFSAQQTALKKRKKEAEDRALQPDGTGEGTGAGTGEGTGATEPAPTPDPTGAAVDDGDTGEDHPEGVVVPEVVGPADSEPAAEQPPLGADTVPGKPVAPVETKPADPKPADPKPATP
jgi:preprotein translocase subunit SecG